MFLLRHACILSCSVVSNSLKPFGLQPSKHFCPWNFPGKNTGVGCHFLHLRFHFIELTSAFPLPELFGACYTLQSRSSKLIPIFSNVFTLGLPRQLSGKESTCQCRRHRRRGFDLWVGKIPWRKAWLPTPVFLPGKLHGQRSLAGYSPQGNKELDTTEHTCTPALHLRRAFTSYSDWQHYVLTDLLGLPCVLEPKIGRILQLAWSLEIAFLFCKWYLQVRKIR